MSLENVRHGGWLVTHSSTLQLTLLRARSHAGGRSTERSVGRMQCKCAFAFVTLESLTAENHVGL